MPSHICNAYARSSFNVVQHIMLWDTCGCNINGGDIHIVTHYWCYNIQFPIPDSPCITSATMYISYNHQFSMHYLCFDVNVSTPGSQRITSVALYMSLFAPSHAFLLLQYSFLYPRFQMLYYSASMYISLPRFPMHY